MFKKSPLRTFLASLSQLILMSVLIKPVSACFQHLLFGLAVVNDNVDLTFANRHDGLLIGALQEESVG